MGGAKGVREGEDRDNVEEDNGVGEWSGGSAGFHKREQKAMMKTIRL